MKLNETLLTMRQNIIKIYKEYAYAINPLMKFVLIFSILKMLSDTVGVYGAFDSIFAIFIMSVLGIFLSPKALIIGVMFIIPLYVMPVNPVLGVVLLIAFIILYLLFMRLYPKESLLIILTVIASKLGVGMLVPFVAALFGSYACIVAISIGVLMWYAIPELAALLQISSLEKAGLVELMEHMKEINLLEVLNDQMMLCTIVIFIIVFTVIYIIRRQSIDYAAYIGIVVGSVMNLGGFVLAVLFLKVDVNIIVIILMTLLCTIIATIAEFFSQVLDYQSAEVVSFEDDENYYYVKIVPKINITTKHQKVKRVYNNDSHHTEING